jgi:hypothetical protein
MCGGWVLLRLHAHSQEWVWVDVWDVQLSLEVKVIITRPCRRRGCDDVDAAVVDVMMLMPPSWM